MQQETVTGRDASLPRPLPPPPPPVPPRGPGRAGGPAGSERTLAEELPAAGGPENPGLRAGRTGCEDPPPSGSKTGSRPRGRRPHRTHGDPVRAWATGAHPPPLRCRLRRSRQALGPRTTVALDLKGQTNQTPGRLGPTMGVEGWGPGAYGSWTSGVAPEQELAPPLTPQTKSSSPQPTFTTPKLSYNHPCPT